MKKAIMYGGGNIGRGFIAQLFYLTGYETVFIDVNQNLVDSLNKTHEYPIYITGEKDYEKFTVKNVRAVNGNDTEAVADEISTADIMATAVGANILKFIAAPIAAGIRRGWTTAEALSTLLCAKTCWTQTNICVRSSRKKQTRRQRNI